MIQKEKQKSISRHFIAGLLIAIVITSILCIWSITQLSSQLQKQTASYLSDVSKQMTVLLDQRLHTEQQIVDNLANTITLMAHESRESLWHYLEGKRALYPFIFLGIVDTEGYSWFNREQNKNAIHIPAVQKALEGTSSIDLFLLETEGGTEKAILFCSPVYSGRKVIGAMMAIESASALNRQLDSVSFDGRSKSALITQNGDIIAVAPESLAFDGVSNLYSDLLDQNNVSFSLKKQLYDDMLSGRSGKFNVRLSTGEMILQYRPLKVSGWYILTSVPANLLSANSKAIMAATIISFIMISLYALVFLFFSKAQRNAQRTLEKMAYVDPVTQGLSLARFNMLAKEALEESSAGQYAMVTIDIQNFKLINDQFGITEGNKTLQYIYDAISSSLQKGEWATRSYADIFFLLLFDSGKEALIARLEELQQKINFFNEQLASKYYLSLKCGIYQIKNPAMTLVSIEDHATYARRSLITAHQGPYCTISFYTGYAQKKRLEEQEITNRMEAALENREFELYLQPKVDLKNQRIRGAEALVRWNSSHGGMLSPSVFIPLFEKNRFIIKLDLYMFNETCRLIHSWRRKGIEVPPISVNLSRVHLTQENFLEQYYRIYARYDFPPELIEFELTESIAFDNSELLSHIIDEIHNLGFRCSMDDFGSGYSSLGLLKDIHVDSLKIDRAFFMNNRDERGQTVIKTIIELGHRLAIETVAEGIETQEQLDFLKQIHCDTVQGYVFSRPLPVDEFEKTILSTDIFTCVPKMTGNGKV